MLALFIFLTASSAGSHPPVNVQPITTQITYQSGKTESQKGLGFIAGRLFVTVNHNIAPRLGDHEVDSRTIFLGQHRVEPSFVHAAHDIAVFEIPAELCNRWCGETSAAPTNALSGGVNWPDPGNRSWSGAVVKDLIVKGPQTSEFGSCRDDLVVEVDAPFYPGSSGGPVIDRDSGEAIGVVQGSFTYEGGRTFGYFKPLHCVFELMGAAGIDRARAPQILTLRAFSTSTGT